MESSILDKESDSRRDKYVADSVLRLDPAVPCAAHRAKGRDMGKVEVSNSELLTIRDAMRELNRLIDHLEAGDSEKFVLTKHGQMRAVVVSVEEFARLRGSCAEAA